jgi:hypothetical protein
VGAEWTRRETSRHRGYLTHHQGTSAVAPPS